MRHIAVDWSGAKQGARSKIWLAEVREGRLVRLECGRSREEIVNELITEAERDPDLLVGLDFAVSVPLWFLRQRRLTRVEDLWGLVAERGEAWLAGCEPPFWGKPGKKRPDLPEHFRRTETESPWVGGSAPKSVFQIGGAGAVGTGSLRGMPCLRSLHAAGFSIWPFHEPKLPTVIEIYPRLLTGPVVKSSPDARLAYLWEAFPELTQAMVDVAASSEDAFDAAVSALVMSQNVSELEALERASDSQVLLEGAIWWHEAGVVPVQVEPSSPTEIEGCPFCDPDPADVIASSRYAIAIRDRYPVSEGHTLVIPRDHARTLYELSASVQSDLWQLVARVRSALAGEVSADGFNIGLNEGEAAGQTVSHPHIHIVPRFDGDVPDPRGGIRWVIPDKATYWER